MLRCGLNEIEAMRHLRHMPTTGCRVTHALFLTKNMNFHKSLST